MKKWESKGEQVTKVKFLRNGNLLLARNGLKLGSTAPIGVVSRSGYEVVEMTLSGEILRAYSGHPKRVRDIAIDESEQYMLAGYGISNISGNDGFRLWDLKSGEILFQQESANPVIAVEFMKDGFSFLTAEQNSLLKWLTPKGIARSLKSSKYPPLADKSKQTLKVNGSFNSTL